MFIGDSLLDKPCTICGEQQPEASIGLVHRDDSALRSIAARISAVVQKGHVRELGYHLLEELELLAVEIRTSRAQAPYVAGTGLMDGVTAAEVVRIACPPDVIHNHFFSPSCFRQPHAKDSAVLEVPPDGGF